MEAAVDDGKIQAAELDRAAEQFLGMIKAQTFWPVVFSGQVVSESEMNEIIGSTVDVFLRSYATGKRA